ncbi:AMP-binding protein [Plantactinospora soyae]|uniref:Long-chain acyl-CoA synthetase n=1 Tax=Plantactinospora soyae TaxID=1544732 RepID=A0A927M266_9ACTN|nr:AMP-binding protein [Plantactinospora soyae]MBE1486798.1 long-chain acyl-CoA synthetase [Plantactinospora soyae]
MQDGASTPAQPPAVTLADRVRLAATTRSGQPALVWPDGTLSWGELDRAVDRVADALRSRTDGPSAGHPARIAIALANSPDFAVAFFGVQRAGLVAVPVNPALTGPELRHILADSGSTVLICTEQVAATIAAIAAELPALAEVHTTLPTTPDPASGAARGPADRPIGQPAGETTRVPADRPIGQPASGTTRVPAEPADRPIGTDPEAVAVLLYTSGTTGRPKGAMLSHRALLANHEQIDRIEPSVVGPDDRVLLALPLFHAYGLNAGLGAVAYHGACGVLVDRFDAAGVLEVVARQRVSVLVGVPSMFLGWVLLPDAPAAAGVSVGSALRTAMASVRVAICGAAPLAVGGAARFAEATGRQIQVGYGLTETAPVLTSTLAGPASKPGSIGRPIPGVELRLVGRDGEVLWRDGSTADPEDAGADNGDNEDDGDDLDLAFSSPGTDPGEIVVRGANLFSGYWPDGHDGPDTDGWWRTGDIAYADVDSDLFLVDRLGELILVNGFNVYPQEVERVLGSHPEVVESAVLGVPHPLAGEAVVAYVVRAPGAAVSAADLSRHCAASLARFKCPSRIEFVGSLPLSAIGRVRRSILRESGGSGDE